MLAYQIARLRFHGWHRVSQAFWRCEGERFYRLYPVLMPISDFAYRRWAKAVPDYMRTRRKYTRGGSHATQV